MSRCIGPGSLDDAIAALIGVGAGVSRKRRRSRGRDLHRPDAGRDDHRHQKLDGCRRTAFESIGKPVMRPPPARRYELADWKHAKVNIDYCVAYDDRLYSASYALVGARVEIRATASVVELLHGGVRARRTPAATGRRGRR
ncbi:Mu transposase domain-containing protein [Sorangium sp. So ce128]|uniref:Mu transposase domain-containing protein n=1 Tax=Sorangium sp. So ce128 TaxID=3133281 RepID=UPI003F5D690A